SEYADQCIRFHQAEKDKKNSSADQCNQLHLLKSYPVGEFSSQESATDCPCAKHTHHHTRLKKRKPDARKINGHKGKHHCTAAVHQHNKGKKPGGPRKSAVRFPVNGSGGCQRFKQVHVKKGSAE